MGWRFLGFGFARLPLHYQYYILLLTNNNYYIMLHLGRLRTASLFSCRTLYSIFSEKERSYYDIIGVSKTARPKQIRTEFLKKARELHPDHNPSPHALEEFKHLKQAYETLRDPQKRYIYDSGISTDGVNMSAYTGSMDWRESGRKYYENKWYQFRKGDYQDQRDDYYEEKLETDENEHQRKLWYRFIGLVLLMLGYFSYDFLASRKSRQDAQREHIKNLVEGPQEDKRVKKISRYIDERYKAHRVQ